MKKSVLFFCAALGALAFLPTKSDADWTRSNGPWSATVMDILADGSNLFAATRGGGVLLSTDNGSTWTTVAHDPQEIERLDPFSTCIPYDWGIKHG